MFSYCPQCGLIQKKTEKMNCPVCEFKFEDVPSEFLTKQGNLFISQSERTRFIETVIQSSDTYNEELSLNKENILQEQQNAHKHSVAQKVEKYKETCPSLKCPVCGSKNLTTISNVKKALKIGAFGVWGSGDLGKKWHCHSCGYKF